MSVPEVPWSPTETIFWLAGLLEGEGTFIATVPREPGWRPQFIIRLQMTDRDVLERAANVTGQRTIGQQSRLTTQRKTVYTLDWHGARAEHLARLILPYMGERRTQKIQEILAMNLSHRHRNKRQPVAP